MLELIRFIWNLRPSVLFQQSNILALDSFWGYLMANVRWPLCDGKMELVVIAGGLTSVLQPLDVVLTNPFEDRVHGLYNEWILGNNLATSPATCNVHCCQLFVAGCSQHGSRSMKKMVCRSLHKCCISNAPYGRRMMHSGTWAARSTWHPARVRMTPSNFRELFGLLAWTASKKRCWRSVKYESTHEIHFTIQDSANCGLWSRSSLWESTRQFLLNYGVSPFISGMPYNHPTHTHAHIRGKDSLKDPCQWIKDG